MWHRRDFLRLGSAGALASLLPLQRAVAVEGSNLNFLFLLARGGWDITRVFAPEFDNEIVAMEASAIRVDVGDLSYVHDDSRPNVAAFFDAHAASTLILNGISVPSVAHGNCEKLILTGGSAESAPDWAAAVASAAPELPLPHVVLSGTSYAGNLGGVSTRIGTNGMLAKLLDGSIHDVVDRPSGQHLPAVARLLDQRLRGRAEMDGAFEEALLRASQMKDLQDTIQWEVGPGIEEQAIFSIQAFANGLSRSASIEVPGVAGGWDTHQNNDVDQTSSFEKFFGALNAILPQISENTVVVAMSEMGRTPHLNGDEGKDHWPYTSAMIIGPGITGGRTVGGFDDAFYGRMVDPISGDSSDSGVEISTGTFGATLLTLAGMDSEEILPGYAPLSGVLT